MKLPAFLTGGWAAIVPLSAAFGLYMVVIFLPGMREMRTLREEMAERQLFLDGTTVDFYEGLEKRGFTFDNPNAVKSCGCGSSFQA